MKINYPNGSKQSINNLNIQTKKPRNLQKSRLGNSFEDAINESNEYYLKNDICIIYKKPTPIQVVKVDYPSRNKAKIVEAFYKVPSTTDYNGVYKGKYIDFEAKSCHQTSFPFEKIYDHQIHHLSKVRSHGGISFLLIEFSLYNEVFLLDSKKLDELYYLSLNGGRKSIPYEYFKENATIVKTSYIPRIDYIEAVNKTFEIK